MSESASPSRRSNYVFVVGAGLLVAAAAVAVHITWRAGATDGVAGCGPGGGCDVVLASRWSHWLGLPVSGVAVGVDLAAVLATAISRRARGVLAAAGQILAVALLLLILTAGAWFVGIQWLVLHHLCRLCLSAHAAGVAGALLLLADYAGSRDRRLRPSSLRLAVAALFAAAGSLALIVGQTRAPAPVAAAAPLVPKPAIAAAATTAASDPGRSFALFGDNFPLDLSHLPLLGRADAPLVLVCLFDYTCPHCRELHPMLGAARQRYGDRLAVVLLPVPMCRACNRFVVDDNPNTAEACEYARLGLAVWRTDRAAGARFDAHLFAAPFPPPASAARAYAESLVGAAPLAAALTDPAVDRQVAEDVDIYSESRGRAGDGHVPQLIYGPAATAVVTAGTPETDAALLAQIAAHLGPPPGAP